VARRRVVVALGGHAIVPPGAAGTAEQQTETIAGAMREVATLVAEGDDIVVCHGNGPQVGNLYTKNVLARDVVPAMPLHWCVAQTQATIGLAMLTALEAELAARGVERPVVPVLSRVLVRVDDPAWQNPTKPIGVGDGRRVVPSPEPVRSLELGTVRLLLDAGAVVVANGGGGVAMIEGSGGGRAGDDHSVDGRHLRGVDGVVDKDLAAALLATELGADHLVILTDVNGVAVDYGGPAERWLDRVEPDELRALAVRGTFGVGSMAPKAEAALRFVTATGNTAIIGPLERAADALHGRCGTRVEPAGS
jgi:carbamate kinase